MVAAGAMSISDTQSYSAIIRDALYAKAVTLPFFAGFTSRRCRQLQIQPQFIPYLGVYIVEEAMAPDGEYQTSMIRFIHSLCIGFSVIINNNDQVEGELKIDEAFWALMNGIWRDPKLTNFWFSSLPDNVTFRGVEKGTRRHNFGTSGTNETPFAELQYDAWVVYGAEYGPIITDDLLRMHVEIVPVEGDEAVPPADAVQRIIREYEFTPAQGGKTNG
jgi:hypothetical protein